MSARSFLTAAASSEALARPLAGIRAEVTHPSGGIVFVSGTLTQELDQVAAQVRAAWRGVPVCVVPGAGVLSERGEIEGASAASGLLWSGGRVLPIALGEAASPAALRESLASIGARSATALIFARSDFTPEMLEGTAAATPSLCLFGAGTVGAAAITLTAAGEALRGRAVGLVLRDLAPPLVDSAPACRLLTPLRPIEEASGGMVLQIDGRPALDVLSACGPEIKSAAAAGRPEPQPVVFAAIADAGEGERFVVRPVRGIDPSRRGVMIGPEARLGKRLGFAVRDAAAARAGLEAGARSLSQQALGSAPRFAVYLSCAGRGQGLYGAPDVESRILRQRFGDLPIAGMHSSFEIAPWGPGEARVALYTGVLALFRSPS